jgi:hypothetical protein
MFAPTFWILYDFRAPLLSTVLGPVVPRRTADMPYAKRSLSLASR